MNKNNNFKSVCPYCKKCINYYCYLKSNNIIKKETKYQYNRFVLILIILFFLIIFGLIIFSK
jgi:hypothetical protein